MQTFLDSKHLALEKMIELQFEKEEKAAAQLAVARRDYAHQEEETKTTTTRQLFVVS